ncbi:hypothetical protein WN51_12550 [Melipona quadrifasciata]|uniref:Uncharacterized protein n=1 Tax=Melipona quadrifasciata TaxID=166423 RepID=A0A0N0BH60_9HYME|nr:hypothetical protein WN51_12550 [Melipona quadrifasciata]
MDPSSGNILKTTLHAENFEYQWLQSSMKSYLTDHSLDTISWIWIIIHYLSHEYSDNGWIIPTILQVCALCRTIYGYEYTEEAHTCPPLANYVALPARLRGQPDD